MTDLETIRGVLILDKNVKRIFSKYYDSLASDLPAQSKFEKGVLEKMKTGGAELEIGGDDENELMLSEILRTFVKAVQTLIATGPDQTPISQRRYDAATLLDSVGVMAIIVDEMIDGGILFCDDIVQLCERVVLKRTSAEGNVYMRASVLMLGGGKTMSKVLSHLME